MGLRHEMNGASDGSAILDRSFDHVLGGFVNENFFVVGECDHGVRGLLNVLDLVCIENELFFGIEAM
jgi:hypothetical protein